MTRPDRAGAAPDVPPPATADAAAEPFAATVPGALAPVLSVDLPTGLRPGTRARIARRQIAERLGLAEEALEIRPLRGNDWRRVVVCDLDRAAGWRAGPAPGAGRALLPDYLALPAAAGVWTLTATPDGLAARLGPDDGFGAPLPLALAQLRIAAAADPPRAALLIGPLPDAVSGTLAELGIAAFASAGALRAEGHPVPAPDPAGVDLGRPPDAALRDLRAGLRRWARPAILAACALALWSAAAMLDARRGAARLAEIRETTETLLRATFLPDGPILDPRRQVERRLEILTAPGTGAAAPLALLRRAAPILDDSGTVLEALRYTPAEGMRATVTGADFAAVEALADRLRAGGVTTAVLDAQSGTGGAVNARLRLGAD